MTHSKVIDTPLNSSSNDFDLFDRAAATGFGDIHFKFDPQSGMRAIIAIHNTKLGPALGGCRFVHYPDTNAALYDVMNLSRAMSYKAAMAGLPLGGGKAVIMYPEKLENRVAVFEAYGRFVDELGGRFITSVDSGTGVSDMDIVARFTKHLRSTSDGGDPSPSTAFGVRRGIEAAVKFRLQRDSLDGIHVAIQGAGHVGYPLAKELHEKGAKLSICDVNQEALQRCADEFSATIVGVDEIFSVSADVFAPCALGGAVDQKVAQNIDVKIIAGAANNALAHAQYANILQERNILYAPDYVINAGGLMQVWITDPDQLNQKISGIYQTLLDIFERSSASGENTAVVAQQMAEEILYD